MKREPAFIVLPIFPIPRKERMQDRSKPSTREETNREKIPLPRCRRTLALLAC